MIKVKNNEYVTVTFTTIATPEGFVITEGEFD